MIVFQARLEINEANAFVAACPETKQALLVDVGELHPDIPAFLEAKGLKLSAIFITHDHYDHTSGLREVLDYAGHVPIYAFKIRIENVQTRTVREGNEISLGKLKGIVHHTPGHTPDGLTLVFPGHAFTGDALFAGSVGGTASRQQYDEQLDAIRRHIFTLPPNTRLHVGHGPSSTVAIESRFNPFFV